MAIDLNALWDFQNPSLSEHRFRTALATATGDDALIIETQIARTYSLRREYDTTRQILKSIQPRLATAGPEPQVRAALELGRSYASASHPPDAVTPEAQASARSAYSRAYDRAKAAGLDSLAIDALHMLAFVDTAPVDQLKWGQAALDIALSSSHPAAKAWEAPLRNNIGHALLQLARYDEALAQFQRAATLREQGADEQSKRIARWTVARTLRSLNRIDEALAAQLSLEHDCAAAQAPDIYVFEELELLYRAQGNHPRAAHYAALRQTLTT
jgi:tetratricopeptide (TPR) repeat protein